MNVRLLRKVKRAILAEPTKFRMDKWTCGSAHCIAGTICALDQSLTFVVPKRKGAVWLVVDGNDEDSSVVPIERAAADNLEIEYSEHTSHTEADRLFHLPYWPKQFRDDYRAAQTLKARAGIAAKRIEHFIKTNGGDE